MSSYDYHLDYTEFSRNAQLVPIFGEPHFLNDDSALCEFDDMLVIPDCIESADRRGLPPAIPVPILKGPETVKIINFTSHAFRGFLSSKLTFRVEFKPEIDPTMLWLLSHKRLYATASLTAPHKMSGGEYFSNIAPESFAREKTLVRYKWYKELGIKDQSDSKIASNYKGAVKGNEDSPGNADKVLDDNTVCLKAEQDGKVVYMMSVDVCQEFLRGQEASRNIDDDINIAMSSPFSSIESLYLMLEVKDGTDKIVATAASDPIL